uniref:WW domain-containing protein n=1 Tax=Clastoptera arizonana TaxID=38151 RepID=A0A1B6D943_9HEMI
MSTLDNPLIEPVNNKEWAISYSSTTNRMYFYNKIKNYSVWEKPEELLFTPESINAYVDLINKSSQISLGIKSPSINQIGLKRRNEDLRDPNTTILIALDTNILLNHFKIIQNKINAPIKEFSAKFVIPSVVYLELLNLATGQLEIKRMAKDVINFFELCEERHNAKIIVEKDIFTQSPEEAWQSLHNDEQIISYCVQEQRKGLNIILLTMDKNMQSRAMLSNVRAIKISEFLRTFPENEC